MGPRNQTLRVMIATLPKHGGLTGKQKASLAMDARRAYEKLRDCGALEDDETFDDFRHRELRDELGIDGLRSATQSDFRRIRAWFYHLAGWDDAAFDIGMRTGDLGDGTGESVEDRDLARWKIISECKRLGFSAEYLRRVLSGKCQGRRVDQLTAREAWNVVYTLRNRAAARDGRGDPGGRNQTQREAAHA